jgi:hypothetical protein
MTATKREKFGGYTVIYAYKSLSLNSI